MKRTLSLLLAMIMVLSVFAIAGCGKKATETDNPVSEEFVEEAPEKVETPADSTAEEAAKEEVAVEKEESAKEPEKSEATKPATKPVATKPVATKPVATKPAQTTPAVTTPVATAPVETTPVVTPEAPVEEEPAEPEVIYTKDGYLGIYPIIQELDNIKMVEDMVEMSDGVRLYTRYVYPKVDGKVPDKLPIIFERTPYDHDQKGKNHPIKNYETSVYPNSGYLLVYQNGRGTGNSEGDHTPYAEREGLDGYETLEHLRTLPQYNGEIFLKGHSYHATSHYLYLDKEGADLSDIKGAVFQIQTDRMLYRDFRYGANYSLSGLRFMLGDLMKRTYPGMEKLAEKANTRPYRDFTKRATGEDIPELIEWYYHDKEDDYWRSRPGYYAAEHITFPVLFMEGWYDYYVNGMFSMWERLPAETRAKSAFVVGPWEHGTTVKKEWDFQPEHSSYTKYFGAPNTYVAWYDSIRKGETYPYVELGKVTYHSLNGDKWTTNVAPWDSKAGTKKFYFNDNFTLTEEAATEELSHTYKYDPENIEHTFTYTPRKEHEANSVHNIKSFTTAAFTEETDFYGKPNFKIDVSSDCEDTSFNARLYYVKENGDTIMLTHTAATLSYFYPDYKPGDKVTLDITFPYTAFTIKEGEKIRVDVSSYGVASGGLSYIPHSNTRGHWAEVTETKVANNTIYLKDSYIELPLSDAPDIPPVTQ